MGEEKRLRGYLKVLEKSLVSPKKLATQGIPRKWCVYVCAVEPYLPEPFCPKPAPIRQSVLPPPLPPGHSAPTMPINSMQWAHHMRPPTFVDNSRPMMPPFDGGRGYGNVMMSADRSANLIVVPTLREKQPGDCCLIFLFCYCRNAIFLDPEGGSQKATLVVVLVVVVVVISSLKIPKAFLISSGAQRNFAYTLLLTFPTDLPSQIFHLFSN